MGKGVEVCAFSQSFVAQCWTGFNLTWTERMQLYCKMVGSGEPTMLLLHGLAGNGEVWQPLLPMLTGRWLGSILIPDLRGHGRSPHARHYGFGQHAADVAGLLMPGQLVTVVAHSMGAVVALAVASGMFGVSVDTILGFGVKIHFSDAEIEKSHARATSPVRWFESRGEAVETFLRLAGLTGLVGEETEVVNAGVRQEAGRWRLAADPRIYSVVGPRFEDIFSAAKTRLLLACGSDDPMVTIDDLRRFDAGAIELPGMGHNFHVRAPQVLFELIERLL